MKIALTAAIFGAVVAYGQELRAFGDLEFLTSRTKSCAACEVDDCTQLVRPEDPEQGGRISLPAATYFFNNEGTLPRSFFRDQLFNVHTEYWGSRNISGA